MEKNSKNIDDLFRDQLGDYSEVPPPASWDALEKRMAAKPSGRPSAGFPRTGYIALSVLVAAITVATVAHKMTAGDDARGPVARNTLVEQATGTTAADHATESTVTSSAVATTTNNNNPTAPAKPGAATAGTEVPAAQASTAATGNGNTTAATPGTLANNTPASSTAGQAAVTAPAATTHTSTSTHGNTHTQPVSHKANSVPGPSYVLSGSPANTTAGTHLPIATTQQHGNSHPHTSLAQLPSHGGAVAKAPGTTPQVALATAGNTQMPTERRLSNPADVATDAADDRTDADQAAKGNNSPAAKSMALQAHRKMVTAPATVQPAANTSHANNGEEVESLTTGMKQIGINNSLNAMGQKAVPGVTTTVYNNSLNAAPEQRTGNGGGGMQLADAPATATQSTFSLPPAVKTTPAPKEEFNRFEAGFKIGYEKGLSGGSATKFAAAPYVQYNMSPKLALMLQPAVKTAKVNNVAIGNPQSYYKVNNDGTTKMTDSLPAYIPIAGSSTPETLWVRHYSYSQTHDSVVKSNTYGGTYVELELPILLKYSISSRLSVYGGPNISYSKLMAVTEHTYTSEPITQTGTANTVAAVSAPAPAAPALNTVINYNGTPYSSYSGPAYAGNTGSSFRLGYMAGVTYQFRDRWMADGLIQQGMAKQDVKAGYNINSAVSSAYFRLSIGYKLTK